MTANALSKGAPGRKAWVVRPGRVHATTVAREQVSQDARFGPLQLAQSRRQLLLAAKADTVARKRYSGIGPRITACES